VVVDQASAAVPPSFLPAALLTGLPNSPAVPEPIVLAQEPAIVPVNVPAKATLEIS
jgi:hypothetical protein